MFPFFYEFIFFMSCVPSLAEHHLHLGSGRFGITIRGIVKMASRFPYRWAVGL